MAAVRRNVHQLIPHQQTAVMTHDTPVRPMAITQSKVLNQTAGLPCLRFVTVLGHHSSDNIIPYFVLKEVSQIFSL